MSHAAANTLSRNATPPAATVNSTLPVSRRPAKQQFSERDS
jgi:hypothetical protein